MFFGHFFWDNVVIGFKLDLSPSRFMDEGNLYIFFISPNYFWRKIWIRKKNLIFFFSCGMGEGIFFFFFLFFFLIFRFKSCLFLTLILALTIFSASRKK